MRKLLVLAAFAFVLAAAPGTAATTAPTLRLRDLHPLVLDAAGFRSAERIRVVVVAPSGALRRVAVATRAGTARFQFGDIVLGRCAGFSVRATGSKGSTATLKRPPLPACMP